MVDPPASWDLSDCQVVTCIRTESNIPVRPAPEDRRSAWRGVVTVQVADSRVYFMV